MNDPEKDDPVWKLLSAARKVEPSPFFSRNVVREARQLGINAGGESQGLGSWLVQLFSRPAFALGAAAAVVTVIAVFAFRNPSVAPPVVDTTPLAPKAEATFDPAGEFEDIEYLGHLMAVEDTANLDDETLADLVLLAGR